MSETVGGYRTVLSQLVEDDIAKQMGKPVQNR